MDAKNTLTSRSMWVGIAMVALGMIDQFIPVFGGSMPSWVLSVAGVVQMILRQITTTPVSISAPVGK